MAVSVPVAIGGGLAMIALCYILSAAWIHRERRNAPAAPPVGTADLDPYEFALLAGGRRRVGELALAQAYLDGLIHVERAAGVVVDALIRPAPGVTDTRFGRHPVLGAALRRCLRSPRYPGAFPPYALVRAAATGDWVTWELTRLRGWGLLLPERISRPQGLRRFAAGAHLLSLMPMALLAAAATSFLLFSLSVRFPGVPLLPFAGLAGFLATGVCLYLLYFRFGAPAVMAPVTGIAVLFAALGPLPLPLGGWVAAGCGAWFAAYGVFAATDRYCGARTSAGDDVLAAARADLHDGGGTDYEWALMTVALFGLAHLRNRERAGVPAEVGTATASSAARLGRFARKCGRPKDRAAGPSGDGGPGGSSDADGRASGFGRIDGGGSGGDGGGGGGGDGGGGGGGGGGD